MVVMICFHAYKSVAPLKRFANLPLRAVSARFPRLQKRGPIEAQRERIDRSRSCWFPRLQKRGPIEAPSPHEVLRFAPLGFHAYKSVAPLKLDGEVNCCAHTLMFPRLQKRGPIEAA